MNQPTSEIVSRRFNEITTLLQSMESQHPAIGTMIDGAVRAIEAGATLFTAGNGGSAAEALHLAEELVGRYRSNRDPIRSICLNADVTALTCIANDYGYENVFARQAEALLRSSDILSVFSTSGNSENLIKALRVAKQKDALTIGFLGADGGAAAALCDHAIVVPSNDSAHIQEVHQVIMHVLCEALEPTS